MKTKQTSFLIKPTLVLVLSAVSFLTSCTNTSTPVDGLVAVHSPNLPKASKKQRKTAFQTLAAKLASQRNELQQQPDSSINVANLRPVKPTAKQALLAPNTLVEPSQLEKAKVPVPEATSKELSSVASIPKLDSIKSDSGPLGRFHAKLNRLKNGKRSKPITILHIGDSHVASDSFSRGIRKSLQARYGDAGRGMVIPARAFKYGVADQVKLTASGHWRGATALKRRNGRFGISGVSVSSRSSRSSMTMKSQSGKFDWAEVTVVSGPSQGSFDLKIGGIKKRFDAYSPKRGSKSFRLHARGKAVTVSPGGGAQTTILNWATGKNSPGIRYINFGLIGATVDITKRFDPQLVANDVRRLDPDLIIYGYGTNEGFNDNLRLDAYAKRASKYVDSLKRSAPNADVVYLGAASGLRRRGNKACGNWSTPPKLAGLRRRVKTIAAQQGAGYWDWSAAMGGACAINSWAGQGLASKDRVHLTSKGYRRSANAFANWLTKPAQSNVRVALN